MWGLALAPLFIFSWVEVWACDGLGTDSVLARANLPFTLVILLS